MHKRSELFSGSSEITKAQRQKLFTSSDSWQATLAALARISQTLAAHLANHLAASRFVLPHRITLDMPWSSSPPGDQSITQPEPPECEISGLVWKK